MKKLLNVVLMLSAMAAVVPAQAVRTKKVIPAQTMQTRKKTRSQVAIVAENQDFLMPEQDFLMPEEDVRNNEDILQHQKVQNEASMLNRKAIIAAAVAAGAVAIAAYMYATAATSVDCNTVRQAYCAGSQVAPAALQACKAYLPWISCRLV